jgi:hypothetical protein
MPSASTHVCGSHHTRSFHSRRRVAFQDDELLERQFRAAGSGPMVAFSIDSRCDRYLRSQAARAFAQSRSADRRRTLRGWHLPPTQNRCILTNSRIPRLSENRLATFPAWVGVRLTPHPELRSRLHAIHTGCRSRGRVLRRDVAPWIVPKARPRNRTPLVPTAHTNDRCGERIGHRPNRTERPRQRDAPRTGPRHLKPPAEPTHTREGGAGRPRTEAFAPNPETPL